MGGGGNSNPAVVIPPQYPENQYTDQLASWATRLWGETQPIRTSFTEDYFMPVLKGNYNPETLPGFAPQYDLLRGSLEGQYNQAKQNIMANTPRGGALEGALANLEYNRARETGLGTSQLSSNILGDVFNKAYNYGLVSAPQQSFGGMGTAAQLTNSANNAAYLGQLQSQLANAQMSQQGNAGKSGLGSLGTGLGALGAMALAPMTGGGSLFGNAVSGIGAGKGAATGIGASGLGGYSALMKSAMSGGLG